MVVSPSASKVRTPPFRSRLETVPRVEIPVTFKLLNVVPPVTESVPLFV